MNERLALTVGEQCGEVIRYSTWAGVGKLVLQRYFARPIYWRVDPNMIPKMWHTCGMTI